MTLTRFFSIDLRSLAIFRIAVASIVLADLLRRFPDAALFYSDAGLLPRRLLFEGVSNPWRISAYFMNGTPLFAACLIAFTGFCAFALLVGWKTRRMSFLLWFLVASLHARNPMVNSSAEQLLRLLLLWSVGLPLGARFSLDALRSGGAPPAGSVSGPWAAGLLLQPCLIYWVGAVLKSGNHEWTHGLAVGCAVSIFEMGTPFGKWLAQFPSLTALLTHGVLWLELVGPFLLFAPVFAVRMAALASFWALQAGFGMSLSLWIFPWAAAAAMIPFLPSEWWDRFFPSTRGEAAPKRPFAAPQKIMRGIGAVLLVYALAWGLARAFPGIDLPDRFRRLGWSLHAEQSWGMFVPPGRFHNWYVVAGKTRSGRYVDVLHENRRMTLEKPATSAGFYASPYWQNYLSRLGTRAERQVAVAAADRLRELWNRAHPSDGLEQIRIYRMQQRFYPKPGPPRRTLVVRRGERGGGR